MKALGRPVIVSLFRSMGVVGDGTPDLAQMVLTGVSAADSVVSLFDGRTLLGSTTAAASGIWRFTIGAFLDEIHSFTAVATNAAGEMSAASPAVRVTAVMNRIASIVPDAAAVGDSIANAGVLMLNGTTDANLLHRVTAFGTDAPGNTGAPPSALTLDAQTQAAPAIAPLSSAGRRAATLAVNDATELNTVAFAVSGLNAGASAKVTFADAANQSNSGHFIVNSVEQTLGTIIDVPASKLGAVSASVSDALQAQSLDGGGRSAGDTAASTVATAATVTVADGAPSITAVGTGSVAEPVSGVTTVIGDGATLELAYAYSGTITFAGATGTLIIDNSSSFSGTIAGQLVKGNVIDLADITAGANATISYSGNNSPGTLTVSDGTHTANIALEGNYSLANFIAYSDGHGGTPVIDPPLTPNYQVTYSLRDVDGGPNYFAQFNNSFPTDPSFFPIGVWYESVTSQADINLDKGAVGDGQNRKISPWHIPCASPMAEQITMPTADLPMRLMRAGTTHLFLRSDRGLHQCSLRRTQTAGRTSIGIRHGPSPATQIWGFFARIILMRLFNMTNIPEFGTLGTETVGLIDADEGEFLFPATEPIDTTANSLQDGRVWWMNNTWNYL